MPWSRLVIDWTKPVLHSEPLAVHCATVHQFFSLPSRSLLLALASPGLLGRTTDDLQKHRLACYWKVPYL